MATVADRTYPYDTMDAFEAAYRDIYGSAGSGVFAAVANELAVFGDSSGRQVKLPTGAISVLGQFGGVDSQKTLAIATNTSGQPRIDRVIARNVFSVPGTPGQIEFDVLTGTPGSSPVAPALTSDGTMHEVPLAQIGPLASGFTTVAAGQVTNEACYISNYGPPAFGEGAAFALWIPVPSPGMMFYLRDSGGLYLYDGTGFIQQRRQNAQLDYVPGGNQDVTGAFAVWPTGLHLSVDVPAWATRARCRAHIGQVQAITGTLDHNVNLTLGTVLMAGQNFAWDLTFMPSAGSGEDIDLIGDQDVSAIAGTTVALEVVAERASGSGVLRADASSSSHIDVEFR